METVNKRGRKKKETDYNNIFSVRLRELINERKVTQQEISENITASRQALNKWVNGETVPDILAAAELADYFGVSSDYLLGMTDSPTIEPQQISAEKYIGLSPEATEHLADMQYCDFNTPYKRTDILNMIILSGHFRSLLNSLCEACAVSASENFSDTTKTRQGHDGSFELQQLSKADLIELYSQKASKQFNKIIEKILKEVSDNAKHNPPKE